MATRKQMPDGISKTTENRVMSLYKEGWHIPNIMRIAHLDLDTVKTVLEYHKVKIDSILK